MSKFRDIIARHKQGEHVGITSVCSAHPWVIEAALRLARKRNTPVLIEATSNQVDQTGGYTGMTPGMFRDSVMSLAVQVGLEKEMVILGGDHLGPNRWQHLSAEVAMQSAEILVEHYVKAGFRKIHLDCSMACADDQVPLQDEVVASRAARLALKCEAAQREQPDSEEVFYIIGTEVPVPGGADHALDGLEVTSVESAAKTIEAHKQAFSNVGLINIWHRVLGLVVQPGVEFSHESVVDFVPEDAKSLGDFSVCQPHLLFEAHSTDYQKPSAYKELVKHHFAILKVGPQLTFALREALYGLAAIEQELFEPGQCSNLKSVVEDALLISPEYWKKYYKGDERQQYLLRHFSYSDRIRYYWNNADISKAVNILLDNLNSTNIPLPLISQYLPNQYQSIRNGKLSAVPFDIVIDHVSEVLSTYQSGCE